jgi:hypothetical protein
MIIRSYNLFLDSSQQDYPLNGNNGAYSLFLRKPITKTVSNSVFRVKVIQTCIPFSFTEINTSNNTLYYTYNGNPFNFTIPAGSYTILSLLSYIQTYLTGNHSVFFNFTFNQSTNFATFAFASSGNTGNHSFTFLHTDTNNKPILKQVGFTTSDIIFTCVGGFAAVSSTSNQSVNIAPSKNLYIRSDNLQQTSSQEAIVNRCDTSDILAIIPINVPFSNYINFYNNDNFIVYINNESIDNISLYLTDATSDDTLIGLVLNWSVTLVIEEYELPLLVDVSKFKENNIDSMNKKVINELENQKTDDINYLLEQKNKLESDILEIQKKKKMKE